MSSEAENFTDFEPELVACNDQFQINSSLMKGSSTKNNFSPSRVLENKKRLLSCKSYDDLCDVSNLREMKVVHFSKKLKHEGKIERSQSQPLLAKSKLDLTKLKKQNAKKPRSHSSFSPFLPFKRDSLSTTPGTPNQLFVVGSPWTTTTKDGPPSARSSAVSSNDFHSIAFDLDRVHSTSTQEMVNEKMVDEKGLRSKDINDSDDLDRFVSLQDQHDKMMTNSIRFPRASSNFKAIVSELNNVSISEK